MREFKVYWNSKEKVPIIIDERTDNIKIKTDNLEYLTTDLRPVFLEEKHLIKELFSLEESIYESSVWCTKLGKYIIDGGWLKKSYIKAMKEIKSIEELRIKIFSFEKTNKMIEKEKIIINKFIKLNYQHLYYLLESEERDNEGHFIGAYPFINEVSQKHKDRIKMVSFSGGKDSTAVSHLVRKALNDQSILHIFGDTTLELPKTYEYVEKFKIDNPMTPFFEEKNEENNFFEMCEEIGPPSRVKSWCCSIFKTGPMGTTLSNFDEKFLTFYGVRRKESIARSKYEKINLTPKIHGEMVASPVIDWLDIDIWLYLLTEKIKFNDSYRYGFSRVGCWVCPNNSDWSQLLGKLYVLKEINPSLKVDYNDWENFLYKFAKKIILDYNEGIGKKLSKNELSEEIKNYVNEGKWKARQGGAGLEKSSNIVLESKECINEKNSYRFVLNRNVQEELFELLKPFGKLIFTNKGNKQEIYILSREGKVLFKIFYREQNPEIKITLVDTKDRYLYGKIKRQLNKYNSCVYCQACNSTCKFGAISVGDNSYKIDENKCVHCLNCVSRFQTGCLISSALKIKK
ncbi:MAG: phosphoadenosine phosphosulfate reductase family protein [Fusobacterium sp. JB019]|nr:phosphoadenosine phosphosulfate reductase family protein [Fusobacterium sp. JB019]